jgi:hypothetical protein
MIDKANNRQERAMLRQFLTACIACGLLVLWGPVLLAQEDSPESKPDSEDSTKSPEAEKEKPGDEQEKTDEQPDESADTSAEFISVDSSSPEEPEIKWPYQEPLFALSAKPLSRIQLGVGFANNPDVNSLAFTIGGSFAFWDMAVYLKMPFGLAMNDEAGNSFTYGDMEFGAKWLITHDEETNKHLTVGLTFIAPLSRAGEEKDLAGVQSGTVEDTSNFGKRYLLAQKPLLDMGLIPKLNIGMVPYVAFGQNIGRVSLQTDFGCLILIMDNVDATVYGTDRRYGFVLFYDLAVPVAITQELSVVAEFNATVALDGLLGTGFAFTLGPRYTVAGFSAGIGIQLPIGVDNKPPDDDKMVGRFDSAFLARHHIAAILDLSYSF